MKIKQAINKVLSSPLLSLWIFYLLLVCLILCLSGFRGLYGQDSHAYLSYSRQFTQYFTHGILPGNFQWPVIYPLLGSLLSFLISSEHLALLSISILAFGISVSVCFKILNRIIPGNNSRILIYLALFFCGSPFLVRNSLTVMSESLATAFCLLAYYNLWCPEKKFRLVYFFFWASLAVCTRYLMGILLILPLVYLIYSTIKSKNYLIVVLALILPFLIFGVELYFKGFDVSVFYRNDWMQSWSIAHFFEHSFFNGDGWQIYRLPNLLHVFSVTFHPGFIFCGLLLLVLSRFRHSGPEQYVMLFSVLFYLFFMAGLATQSQRFLLPVIPLILILYFPAFLRLLSWKLVQPYFRILIVFTIGLQGILIYRAVLPFIKRERMEKSIALYMKQFKPPRTLYTSGMEGALETYGVTLPLKSLYFAEYTNFDKPSFVLINPAELEKKWKGTIPYKNWMRISEKDQLVKIKELEGQWVVYELR